MIDLRKVWRILLPLSMALILLAVYLALYFAPLPSTGVRSADSVLSSVEGSKITVVGFVTDYRVADIHIDAPMIATFQLADFSDYHRYLDAVSANTTSTEWWTVHPIDVHVLISSGLFYEPPTQVHGELHNGVNVSVLGTIQPHASPPELSVPYLMAETVTVGSAGSFGVMTAPVAQKIFYFHMPSAWVCYLAFGITLLASVFYLKTRNQRYDRWAHSSAELGVVFATIAILTGPIWAKQEWGVYWRWDDTKLVTTFILWLVYIGYLSLRAAISEPSARSRISAVYGILGFITVPMSFLSARIAPLLSSSHPEVIASSSGSLSPEAGMTIGIAVVAFTVLFITMLIKRVEIAESEEEIEELKRKIGGEE
jgi:heme exporter protein C